MQLWFGSTLSNDFAAANASGSRFFELFVAQPRAGAASRVASVRLEAQ